MDIVDSDNRSQHGVPDLLDWLECVAVEMVFGRGSGKRHIKTKYLSQRLRIVRRRSRWVEKCFQFAFLIVKNKEEKSHKHKNLWWYQIREMKFYADRGEKSVNHQTLAGGFSTVRSCFPNFLVVGLEARISRKCSDMHFPTRLSLSNVWRVEVDVEEVAFSSLHLPSEIGKNFVSRHKIFQSSISSFITKPSASFPLMEKHFFYDSEICFLIMLFFNCCLI